MKKRLFLIIMCITLIATTIVCVSTTLVYYDFYVEETKNQIKTIVKLSSSDESWANPAEFNKSVQGILNAVDYNIRITVVEKDGTVIYDNWTKGITLENHLNRPEIIQAFNNGNGEYTRYSETISSDMYYYAVKINDSQVLRASREINSINGVFTQIIPMIVVLYMSFIVISYIAANVIAKKLLSPIDDMIWSLDDMLEEGKNTSFDIYDEFQPLAYKIREQKVKINHYIDELKYERDTISIITENMREGFILINKDKKILSINSSGKQMIGNERIDTTGHKHIIELTRNTEILLKIDEALKENKHLVYDIDINNKHYRYYLSPVKEQQSSSVAGLLILIEDITIQKNAENMRSEFSANVSHELKTPLTTMIGFAEMIKEGLITDIDSIKKYCNMINKEGLRLISLIEDIIRLSKIEEGIYVENNQRINLKEISNEVVSLLNSKADNLNIKLNLKVHNVFMQGNRNYISELLYNLVDNGIKYNKSGGTVDIYINYDGSNINIIVKDTGVGIPKEHVARIFERFYRVDKSRSKDTGGTGLGLSIVKHITELYDGTIELASQENKGTEITIKFPVNK